MGKAFIFTLDAILAIIICSILFSYTYLILASLQYSTVGDVTLLSVSSDVLTSLEKSHTLQNSVYYSRTSDIRNVLNNLSSTVCSDIVVYSSDNTPLLMAKRSDCNCTTSRSLLVRSFVMPQNNGTLSEYLAKMEACYK